MKIANTSTVIYGKCIVIMLLVCMHKEIKLLVVVYIYFVLHAIDKSKFISRLRVKRCSQENLLFLYLMQLMPNSVSI